MRVLLHICFCLKYKAGLINDKEKHRHHSEKKSILGKFLASYRQTSSVPCHRGAGITPYITVLSNDCKFTSSSHGCDCSIDNHISCFHNTFSAPVWGKNSVVRYVSRSCISKTLIDECTFQVNCLKFQMRLCKFLRSCKHKYSPISLHCHASFRSPVLIMFSAEAVLVPTLYIQ
jgi:hypothetical protein